MTELIRLAIRAMRYRIKYDLLARRISKRERRFGIAPPPRRPDENRDLYLYNRTTQIELAQEERQ